MKKIALIALLCSFYAPTSWGGKAEEVQESIKKVCGKDIAQDEALRLVKNLFLSCAPGQKVDINGCQVPCMKNNAGAVVGQ